MNLISGGGFLQEKNSLTPTPVKINDTDIGIDTSYKYLVTSVFVFQSHIIVVDKKHFLTCASMSTMLEISPALCD